MRTVNRRDFLTQSVPAVGAASLLGLSLNACRQSPPPRNRGVTLWQLPSQTRHQSMSYVLRTLAGEIIVIDGGWTQDAVYLTEFIDKISGGRGLVHAWILTHPHLDHVDALTEICRTQPRLRVRGIYGSLPDDLWMQKHEDAHALKTSRDLRAALEKTGRAVEDLALGQRLHFKGADIEILSVWNPELTCSAGTDQFCSAVNNQSVVFRLKGPNKSVLFLGDLGVEGGQKLLHSLYRNRLQADWVQMAHHGQRGVEKEVYEVIGAKGCLWPTPGWLWDNDNGGGVNSGPWKTLEVRAWMDELGVKEHIVAKDGVRHITL